MTHLFEGYRYDCPEQSVAGHAQRIFSLKYHPDHEEVFITGGWDNCLKVRVRDWSLFTGREGGGGGKGEVKFYPYRKGGWGGEVLTILKGAQKISGGGGGAKSFGPVIYPIV